MKTRNYMPWWQTDKATRQRFLKSMKQESSRILIASGGDHPVFDSGGDGHSIFAQAFIDGLRQTNGAFTAEELLLYVKQRVAGSSVQMPPAERGRFILFGILDIVVGILCLRGGRTRSVGTRKT